MSQIRRRRWILVVVLLSYTAIAAIAVMAQNDAVRGDALDAVVAAPDSHRVLLENDRVRVLEVIIRPGEREPAHTHRWPSVMMGLEAARIRYYDADGKLRFETPEDRELSNLPLGADWLDAEPLHAVENIDETLFRALRVELKSR